MRETLSPGGPDAPAATTAGPETAFERASGLRLTHHGAVRGVTGSCHRLTLPDGRSVLVDCGLFQGAETSPDGRAGPDRLEIDFPLDDVVALVVTHVHIDHVGRIPYLLAAGFDRPIVCTEASAELLPMVLEDALKVGFTRDRGLVQRVLAKLRALIVAVPYDRWHPLPALGSGLASRNTAEVLHDARPDPQEMNVRFRCAGHILGSAYAEFDVRTPAREAPWRVVFSGDLGAPHTPLLPDPAPPEGADVLVIESTYGDRRHEDRRERRARLQALCERCFADGGTLLIPAFSIGRTQELLYELEEIVHAHRQRPAAPGGAWERLVIVVDSPLAADFTDGYAKLRRHWDAEAKVVLAQGRHPLDFAQLRTVGPHDHHLQVVRHLAATREPAIVIAASGMCSGGRIVNYLKAMLPDPRHDVLFCGFQAAGTPGRVIQREGPKGGTVTLDDEVVPIRARIHTIGGYSAHADQADLLAFVDGIAGEVRQVRIVHGEPGAKAALAEQIRQRRPGCEVVVPVA